MVVPLQTGSESKARMPVGGTIETISRQNVCLYATYDEGLAADISRGDPEPTVNRLLVRHDPVGGRFGGRMVVDARDNEWAEDEIRYRAPGNFPYTSPGAGAGFDGTISMWLQGDPDADLNDEFPVDPFHISRHSADASFYLDLTRPNDWRYGSPRRLRFGFYGDSPAQNMFEGGWLLVAGELGWDDQQWHQVVGTFQNANSSADDARAALYIDGQLRATMAGYQHTLTWDIESLGIGLGQRYVGSIDDLLILDRALCAEAVANLFRSDQPAAVAWA